MLLFNLLESGIQSLESRASLALGDLDTGMEMRDTRH